MRATGAGKTTMRRITHFCTLLVLLSLPVAGFAQETTLEAVDQAARERLQASIDFMSALPAFSADIAMDFKVSTAAGESNESALTGHLDMAGTDRARFRVNVDEGAMELFFSPDSRAVYLDAQNQYVDGSAFGERQQALSLMPGREYRPAQILLSDFLHGDATLLEKAEEIRAIAPDDAAAEAPTQIRVAGGGLVADFWIQKADPPLLQRFSMDVTGMIGDAASGVSSAVLRYSLSNWNLSPEFSADHFTFIVPEGATALQQPRAQQAADALQGKPAPAIKLGLLGGDGQLDLAAHQGKHVVILDFWASWCGPCRVGLPIVQEVAAQFAEKGVVFYAVNVGEDASAAQAFVDATGLTAPVAMDPEGIAQRDYQADSIPRTVIIDKDGIIQEVHRGVSPNLKSELTRTLTRLTE